jgi:hypothetical protein
MLRRRTFLKLGAAAMAASAPSAIAAPALYPARPIYLIVGFSAGTRRLRARRRQCCRTNEEIEQTLRDIECVLAV